MKLDPRHLQLLAAIVDNGGLTEGAEALGKSQPSVSRTLTMLEQRVGAALFEMGKRPLRPTELCVALAQQGRLVDAASRSASSIVANYASGKQGLLRIAGSPIFMDGVVAPILAAFQTETPGIRIEQSYAYTDLSIQKMNSGALDLVVQPLKPDAIPKGFQFLELLEGRNVVACGALHPLAQRSAIKLEDISHYSWVAPPVDSPLYQDLNNTLASIGVKDFKISFSGGSLSSIITVLAQTDALTILPYSVVFAARKQGVLRSLNIKIEHPKRRLGVLRPSAKVVRPSIQRFEQFLKSEFDTFKSTMQREMTSQVWRQ